MKTKMLGCPLSEGGRLFARRGGTAMAGTLILLAALCASCGSGRDSTVTGASGASPAHATVAATTVDVVQVVSRKLDITVRLPGDLQPYEVVVVYPKVTGFVDWMGVDRGSHVKSGELIARLAAPEIVSQRAEAQARLQSAQAQQSEAEAKLASDEGTYTKLKGAAATPGVISGNELEVAQKTVEADRARVRSLKEIEEAARQALRSVQEMEGYLQVKAPFEGTVTERNVHPGALVGPSGGPGATVPMVRIEQTSRLRLLVPVPEAYAAGIPEGTSVIFTVPAYPSQSFVGKIARLAHSLDVKTRTMPVEMDVLNPSGRLAPGMFPEVNWPVRRPQPTLFVPTSAVVRTTERTFVLRVRGERAEWVDVTTGATSGNLVEVFGDLRAGEQVALRGTDELPPGTHVTPRLVLASPQ